MELIEKIISGELTETDFAYIGQNFENFTKSETYKLFKVLVDVTCKNIQRGGKTQLGSDYTLGQLNGLITSLDIIENYVNMLHKYEQAKLDQEDNNINVDGGGDNEIKEV